MMLRVCLLALVVACTSTSAAVDDTSAAIDTIGAIVDIPRQQAIGLAKLIADSIRQAQNKTAATTQAPMRTRREVTDAPLNTTTTATDKPRPKRYASNGRPLDFEPAVNKTTTTTETPKRTRRQAKIVSSTAAPTNKTESSTQTRRRRQAVKVEKDTKESNATTAAPKEIARHRRQAVKLEKETKESNVTTTAAPIARHRRQAVDVDTEKDGDMDEEESVNATTVVVRRRRQIAEGDAPVEVDADDMDVEDILEEGDIIIILLRRPKTYENETEQIVARPKRQLRQSAPTTCCADGWLAHNGACYYMERETAANFTQAEEQCRARDAHLWVPNTIDEFEAIRKHCQSTPYTTWVGGRGQGEEDGTVTYTWSDGATSVAGVEDYPWTLGVVPQHGLSPINNCMAYSHSQLQQINIANVVRLPQKGLVWTDCKLATGRFALCEKTT